jgi:hypothetical protein
MGKEPHQSALSAHLIAGEPVIAQWVVQSGVGDGMLFDFVEVALGEGGGVGFGTEFNDTVQVGFVVDD